MSRQDPSTHWWNADLGTLRELDWQAIPDWERPAQRRLLLAAGLIAIGLVALLLLWPLWQEVQVARNERHQLALQVQVEKTRQKDAPALGQMRTESQQKSGWLEQRFSNQLDADRALDQLGSLAKTHQVRMLSVRVLGEQTMTRYRALPLAVQATASYHHWGHFWEALARDQGVMLVSAFQAKAADKRGMDITVEMTVQALAPLSEESGKRSQ